MSASLLPQLQGLRSEVSLGSSLKKGGQHRRQASIPSSPQVGTRLAAPPPCPLSLLRTPVRHTHLSQHCMERGNRSEPHCRQTPAGWPLLQAGADARARESFSHWCPRRCCRRLQEACMLASPALWQQQTPWMFPSGGATCTVSRQARHWPCPDLTGTFGCTCVAWHAPHSCVDAHSCTVCAFKLARSACLPLIFCGTAHVSVAQWPKRAAACRLYHYDSGNLSRIALTEDNLVKASDTAKDGAWETLTDPAAAASERDASAANLFGLSSAGGSRRRPLTGLQPRLLRSCSQEASSLCHVGRPCTKHLQAVACQAPL